MFETVAPVVTTATTVLPAGFSPVPAPRKRNALKAKKQLEQSLLANVDGTGSRQIVADGRTVANAHSASLHFSNNHNNNSNSSSLSVARCRANDHHHVVDQGSPPLRGLSERLLEEAQSMPNCYQFVQQTDARESKGDIPACPAHQTSDIRLQFEIACAALHGVRADLANSLASAEDACIVAGGQSSTDDALPAGPFDTKAYGKCKRPPPPPTHNVRHRQAKCSEISISSPAASTVANPAVVLSTAHSIGYIGESAKLQRYHFAHSSASRRSSSLEFTPVEEDSRIVVPMVRPTSKSKRSAALEILNGFSQGSQIADEQSTNSCGSSSVFDASPPPHLSVRSVRHVVDKLIKQVESQIPRFRRSGGASRPTWAPPTQLDPDLVETRRQAEMWTADHTLCCDLMTGSVDDESRRNVDACTQTSPLSLSCSSSFSWRSETDSIMANGMSGELSNNGFLADNEISGPNSEGSPMMTTTTTATAVATTTTTTTALSSSSSSAFAFSYSASSSSSSCHSLSSVSDVADQKFATPSATAALLPSESDRSSNGATKRLSSQQAFEEALRLLLVAAADDRFDDPKLAEILNVIREPTTKPPNRPKPVATGQQRCQVTFFEQPTTRRSDHWTMSTLNNKSDENSVVSSLSPTFSSPETQVRFHQSSTSRPDDPIAPHPILRPDQSNLMSLSLSSSSSSKTVPGYGSKQACNKFSPDEQQVVVQQDDLVDGAVVGRFKSPQDDDGTRRKKKFSFSTVTGVISSGSNDDSSLDSDKWTPEIRLATEKLSKTFTSKKTLENGKKSAMDLGPPYKAGALIRSGTWLRREDSFAGDKRKSRVAGITALARSKSLTARSRCFQDVHLPSLDGLQIPVKIDALSVSQLTLTMKYALLHLTSILEKNVPYTKPTGFQFGVQRFFKRKKVPESTASTGVFGTALSVIVQRTGHPLPKCIYDAMKYIEANALDAVGIFRKSGVRSRIQKLKSLCDDPSADPVDFDQYQAWDIADLIKLYFRELPDQLLTTNLSETFIYISLYVPESMKMDAIRKALLLLPDENREVLHTLLHFLHKISQVSAVNQMDAQNLAICLAPSLFYIRSMSTGHPNWRRKTITTGFPSEKELKENRAAQLCLGTMIRHYDQIFQISEDVLRSCCFDKNIENRLHFVVSDQGATFDLSNHYTVCCNSLIKEHNDKWRGWIVEGSWHGAEVTSKKITDSFPLKLWRCWTEVEAPPKEVLFRILFERKIWDPDMVSCRVVKKLTDRCDVFQYMQQETPPHLKRDFCTIRIWETDLPEFRGGCVLVAFSVNNEVTELIGDVRANCLAARYVIEPAGRGRSRLTYISRIDLRGRCKTWYNRNFGPLCARQIAQIRDSFLLQLAPGPETRL